MRGTFLGAFPVAEKTADFECKKQGLSAFYVKVKSITSCFLPKIPKKTPFKAFNINTFDVLHKIFEHTIS